MTEGPYKLPESWRWVRLRDVAKVYAGSSAPQDPKYFADGKFPFVRVSDLPSADGSEIVRTRDYVNEKVDELRLKRAPAGTIVFPKSGAAILTNARAILGIEAFIVSHLAAVEVNERLAERLWVFRWLQTVDMGAFIENPSYPSLRLEKVKEMVIPLPPLDEQRRIVARIEELMSRVREAKRLRQQAREDAERLWQSVLADTFPRPGSELPPGWRWVRLGEVCETKMGGTPSTKDTEYWEPPEIVWVTPEDLEKCELNRVFSSRRLISRAGLEKSSSAKLFPQKTVLLSTTATIGKVGVAEKPLSANQQISGIICGDNVNPEFLAYYLLRLGETGLKQLGGTATATHINQTNLRSLPIPLPPLEEQRRIVARLEAVQEKIHALKAAQAETDEKLNQLEQSMLDKAFRGEL